MDFLPLPRKPQRDFLVPDLEGEEYDQREFHTYPIRKDWDVLKLRDNELDEGLRARAAQFLQTWLFFGTLFEFFGRKVSREEYSVVSGLSTGPTRFISTKRLLKDLEDWSALTRRMSIPEQKASQDKIVNCLDNGALVLRDLSLNADHENGAILSMEVHVSIASLLYILEFYSYTTHDNQVARQSVAALSLRCSLFEKDLLQNGWCLGLIERVRLRLGLPGLYYTSLLGPREIRRSHKECTEDGCVANTVVKETYNTKHLDKACQLRPCEKIVASNESLRAILSGGGKIPFLNVSGYSSGVQVQISPDGPASKYIAISHVWADGLGNPTENSLPACDLMALRGWIECLESEHNIESRGTFWIDTICVPIVPQSAREAAILAMRKTYEKAEAVLVLDAELLAVDLPPSSEEILVRILCSSWMTRLWTLQEAALAGRLLFQFRDTAVDLQALKSAVLRAQIFSKEFLLLSRASVPLTNIFGITSSKRSHTHKYALAAVWSSLKWRSTTKIRDTPICLATLIGSSVKSVLDAEVDWKMQAFWASQKIIPSSILWCYGPWLPQNGYRWAPANLLNPNSLRGQLIDNCPPATHDPVMGLVVQGLSGFRLHNTWIPNVITDSFLFFNSEDEKMYKIHVFSDAGDITWESIGLHRIKRPVLLVRQKLTSHGWIPGVLLAEYADFEGITRTQWLGQVSVFQEGGYYDSLRSSQRIYSKRRKYTQAGYDKALDPETGELREAWVEAVSAEQKWAIS